jgi:glycosyltransferase involved in cell wall biosynthesis
MRPSSAPRSAGAAAPAGARPRRILHILHSMDRGGIETWLMHVLRAHDRGRARFELAVQKPGAYDDELAALGIPVHFLPPVAHRLAHVRALADLIRARRFDVVHSHMYYFSAVPLAVARWQGVPVRIAHCHTRARQAGLDRIRRGTHRLARRAIVALATAGIANSRDSAIELYGARWADDPRFDVVLCGFDFDRFRTRPSRSAARARLGLAEAATVVGHVGRFEPVKNHGFLVDVVGELRRRDPSVVCVLAGDGPERPAIERRVATAGLGDAFRFLGLRTDIPRVMAALDALLLPSRSEGFGIVALEAQAAGIPTVVSTGVPTDVDAVPDLVARISLDRGGAAWARLIEERIRAPRPDPAACLSRVAGGRFGIDHCLGRLYRIYEGALPRDA